jgi:hypothetical protein
VAVCNREDCFYRFSRHELSYSPVSRRQHFDPAMLGEIGRSCPTPPTGRWCPHIPALPIVLGFLVVLFYNDGILRKRIPIGISLSVELAEREAWSTYNCGRRDVHTSFIQGKEVILVGHSLTTIRISFDVIG